MGMASHLGPWLLGTQKNTVASVTNANAAAGQIRNMGATVVTQTFNITGAAGAVTGAASGIVIPAGSLLLNVQLFIDTAFGASTTFDLLLNDTVVTNSPSTATIGTGVGVSSGNNAARVALWKNTGSVDKVVTYTLAGTITTSASATVVITYAVRNADGSIAPTSSQA